MNHSSLQDVFGRGNDSVLQAILQTAVDGIVTIDARGIICSANPATERIFGYSNQELVGENVGILMPEKERREHDQYVQNYLRSGNRKVIGIGREVCGRRKDGSLFPLELSVSAWLIGDEPYFTGLLRDITQRREYERQLTRLNDQLEHRIAERTRELQAAQAELMSQERMATLGKVAGGISHEIRNPLNAIKTSAYFLLRSLEVSRDKLVEHLTRIDRQVDIANEVISALASYVKMPDPNVDFFDVESCVQASIDTTDIQSIYTVVFQSSGHLPCAMADGVQVRIAVRNLIRNARDAMPHGGTIHIQVHHDDEAREIVVSVSDNGIGMTPEELQRITEPLYTTKADGLGLGLAITYSILERNGGRLTVSSTPSVGSTFRIHLRTAGSR